MSAEAGDECVRVVRQPKDAMNFSRIDMVARKPRGTTLIVVNGWSYDSREFLGGGGNGDVNLDAAVVGLTQCPSNDHVRSGSVVIRHEQTLALHRPAKVSKLISHVCDAKVAKIVGGVRIMNPCQ